MLQTLTNLGRPVYMTDNVSLVQSSSYLDITLVKSKRTVCVSNTVMGENQAALHGVFLLSWNARS